MYSRTKFDLFRSDNAIDGRERQSIQQNPKMAAFEIGNLHFMRENMNTNMYFDI